MEDIIQRSKEYISQMLIPLVLKSNEPLEGNLFMQHHCYEYNDLFLNKVKNICTLSSQENTKDVLEIGFNSGFSAVLILLSNSNIQLTCVDICEHTYAIPCFNKLKDDFGDRIQLIKGNSINVLSVLSQLEKKYDMIHIDGSHDLTVAKSDVDNSYKLCKENGILIMDDYDAPWLKTLWDDSVNIYNLKNPTNINLFEAKQQDIKLK
jgi:predicted O-methyltransferase YrrM